MKSRKLSFRTACAALLVLASTLAVPAIAQEDAAANGPSSDSPSVATTAPAPLAPETPVVSVGGKSLTLEQLQILVSLRPDQERRLNPDTDLPLLGGSELAEVAASAAAYDVIAERARAEGVTLSEQDNSTLNRVTDNYVQRELYTQVIQSKLTPPTEEQLRARYEEEKDARFALSEELRFRQIFVSSYVPYTVEEGDTLESIAKKVAGDESVAPRILSDETKQPRAESLEKADQPKDLADGKKPPEAPDDSKLPPRALQAGEKLLVPASGETEKLAQEKIQQAHERLKNGEEFSKVAEEVSENPRPGEIWVVRPATQPKPLMQEITDAFNSLQDGTFSEPFRTKHGFHILYREGYQAPGHTPFEQAKDFVKHLVEEKQREDLVNNFFIGILKDEQVTQVNEENLAKTGEAAKPEDVIIKIGDTELTRAQLGEGGGSPLESDEGRTKEGFLQALARHPRGQQTAVEGYIKHSGINDSPRVKFVREKVENTLLASNYLRQKAEESNPEVSDEEIASYFEQNKDRWKVTEGYSLNRLARRFTDDASKAAAKAELEAKLKDVVSVDDFRALVGTLGEKEPNTGPGGALGMVQAGNLPEEELEQIRAVEVPGKTGIIERADRLVAYWVAQAREEQEPTLEEKKEEIRGILQNQKRQEAQQQLLKDAAAEVKVEPLV